MFLRARRTSPSDGSPNTVVAAMCSLGPKGLHPLMEGPFLLRVYIPREHFLPVSTRYCCLLFPAWRSSLTTKVDKSYYYGFGKFIYFCFQQKKNACIIEIIEKRLCHFFLSCTLCLFFLCHFSLVPFFRCHFFRCLFFRCLFFLHSFWQVPWTLASYP